MGLGQIAAGVARRFWFASGDQRNEAVSFTICHLIERIDRFNFSQGADAFAYFSTMAYRAILRYWRREEIARRAVCFTDIAFNRDSKLMRSDESFERLAGNYVPYARAR